MLLLYWAIGIFTLLGNRNDPSKSNHFKFSRLLTRKELKTAHLKKYGCILYVVLYRSTYTNIHNFYICSLLYRYVYFSKRFYFPLGWETSCCIQSHFLTRGYLLIQFYRRFMHRLLKEVSKVHSKCYCIFQSNSKRHAV